MPQTCTARDGSVITDGKTAKLVLAKGDPNPRPSTIGSESLADYSEHEISGAVRSFEQDGEIRWEIVTGDPQWPAIGFRPESILTKK